MTHIKNTTKIVTAAAQMRLVALIKKESLHAVRDPSTLLIAFVLPVILLFLFAYAVSLDIRKVPIGVVLESDSGAAHSLAAAFSGTRYFVVTPARDRRDVAEAVQEGRLKGYVVIPHDFDQRIKRGASGWVQIITYGVQPNHANFVANYARGVTMQWATEQRLIAPPIIDVKARFWFNPEIESRRFLIPGAIAIVMTMIGTLLTALVVAKEWERGTMEALISTPATIGEILIGKLFPYFVLGLLATLGASLLSVTVFGLPFRGSLWALLMVSSVFMIPALGQGLLISAIARNQFIAAQLAILTGFLPALLLSGFLFEIDSMPWPIRLLSHIFPARYFIACLQTIFLAGDVWRVFWPNIAAMLAIGTVLLSLARFKTRKSLDS